jgi:hypothetical protein
MESDQHTITANWVMSAFAVFMIPVLIVGLAVVPIAEELHVSRATRALLLHWGLLAGFASAWIYSAVSLRRMLSCGWPSRLGYFAIVVGLAGACVAFCLVLIPIRP